MPGLMTPNPVFFQLCKVRQSKIPLEQFKSFYLFILTKVHTLFRFPIFTKCHFSGQDPIQDTLHLVSVSPEVLSGCEFLRLPCL